MLRYYHFSLLTTLTNILNTTCHFNTRLLHFLHFTILILICLNDTLVLGLFDISDDVMSQTLLFYSGQAKVSIPAARPNQVPASKPKLVSTGRPKPVSTGASVSTGQSPYELEMKVIVDSGCSPHILANKERLHAIQSFKVDTSEDIFQHEIARLKGQEQRATSDAEILGLGVANQFQLDNHPSSNSLFFGCLNQQLQFSSPSNLGNYVPSPGIFSSTSYDAEFGAILKNLAPTVEVSPVATKRIHTALEAQAGFDANAGKKQQMDVKSTFLYGNIDEEVVET
ncbi:hypothetical protein Tco_1054989 [Tanacetum coccineum]|uniref:Uncharacterized protein n=1 Tax=Tanacetum coccineum TaxID=301880 RepID=A0ABQ5H0E4_9ASTR